MTSLKTADGNVVDLGSFSERLVSNCESYESDVEDAADWSDNEYFVEVDSEDDDVINVECCSLACANESWVDVLTDSSPSVSVKNTTHCSSLADSRQTYDSGVTTQLNDDLSCEKEEQTIANSVSVSEEELLSPVCNPGEVVICDWSTANKEAEVSHVEILSEEDIGPCPNVSIESNYGECQREYDDESKTNHGEFLCMAVRIDDKGFVHPISEVFGSEVNSSDLVVDQVGDDYVDVEGICDDGDMVYGTQSVVGNGSLDQDIHDVTEWLFSIRHELMEGNWNTFGDVPQASYVDTVTVNPSGTMLPAEKFMSTTACRVPIGSIITGSGGEVAHHVPSIVIESDIDVETPEIDDYMLNIKQLSQFVDLVHNYCLPKSCFTSGVDKMRPKRRRSSRRSWRHKTSSPSYDCPAKRAVCRRQRQSFDWEVLEPKGTLESDTHSVKLKLLKKVSNENGTSSGSLIDGRSMHNMRERMRRGNLANRFSMLANVLPDVPNASKRTILNVAVKRICALQAELASNYKELARVKSRNLYLVKIRNRMK